MARKGGGALRKLLGFVAWITGVIVALAVAFGMINGVLPLPIWLGGAGLAVIAGWVVVVTTILGVILAIVDHVR